jgi:hypothetical protein
MAQPMPEHIRPLAIVAIEAIREFNSAMQCDLSDGDPRKEDWSDLDWQSISAYLRVMSDIARGK